MCYPIFLLFFFLRSWFQSRLQLQAEIVALRHQIVVLRRSQPGRVHLCAADRLFWVWLTRLWSGWLPPAKGTARAHAAGHRAGARGLPTPGRGRPISRSALIFLAVAAQLMRQILSGWRRHAFFSMSAIHLATRTAVLLPTSRADSSWRSQTSQTDVCATRPRSELLGDFSTGIGDTKRWGVTQGLSSPAAIFRERQLFIANPLCVPSDHEFHCDLRGGSGLQSGPVHTKKIFALNPGKLSTRPNRLERAQLGRVQGNHA
jgi:hypothetical protein